MLDLAGPLSAFKLAYEIGTPGHYEPAVLSRTGGAILSNEGVHVASLADPEGPIDTLVVVGGPGVSHWKSRTSTLCEHLHARQGGSRVCARERFAEA
jgi:transcriptional regulator GlxA family with amidase domain